MKQDMFSTVGEIASFYDKHYFEFTRFCDGEFAHDGCTYKMEFVESSIVPVLKLSYINDDTEYVLLCVTDLGLAIRSNLSDDSDKPELVDYGDILSEYLFGLSVLDLARFNSIFQKYKKFKNIKSLF